jgi:hypothetical protein
MITLLLMLAGGLSRGQEPDAEGAAFFERKIRPVLVERCYACHSAEAAAEKKLRGGLRLDTREGLRRGGDSGLAIEPGQPEESLLIAALRQQDDAIRMPPRGKLPDSVIADFVAWVSRGAPDPRYEPAATARAARDANGAGRDHWAYRPPVDPPIPTLRDESWPAGAIDRFVLARLEAAGLRPAAEADRARLIRRLSFDLTGLPPTPEAIEAFIADPRPDAYERLVDRLLASPHFGERWGRHWLDVARYAESLTLRGFILKEAWRYRDYVIDVFNTDRPFDRFLREQVAGDLLAADGLEERRRQQVATTFLVLGNTNLEEQDKAQLEMDVVDEQIDVIGKAVLAQTIACARCHDHKFDPIPTEDYYALAGILRNVKVLEHANVSKWIEVPLPMRPEREAAVREREAKVGALEARIKAERGRLASSGGARAGVVAPKDLPGLVVDDSRARKVGEWKDSRHSGTYIGAGYVHDLDRNKGRATLTFQPEIPEAGVYEVRLAYSPGANRAGAVPVTILSAEGEAAVTVDLRADPPIDGRFVSLGRYRFERNNPGYVLISNEGTTGHVVADAVQFLAADHPAGEQDTGGATARATEATIRELEAELKRQRSAGPGRDMAMGVVESPAIMEGRVLVRGSVHSPGREVKRGWPRVTSRGDPPPLPGNQSGRRELAGWLASADNPLTARVFVNRAWHWLLGAGLVRTTDNFGTTGEAPSHPELLDWLATRFVEDGWSVKALVRRIVLSRTYRLAATGDPRGRAIDPENRLLWRASRRRLDAECLRDAMLSAAGRIRQEMGGPSYPADLAADYDFRHTDARRSVYAPVFRNALPELFEVFDFADPSMVVGRRDTSTVATQALFLLNNPFVVEQARHAAGRLLAGPGDDPARLDRAYHLVLGRAPTPVESRIALEFLAGPSAGAREESWSHLVHALFESADFRYLD